MCIFDGVDNPSLAGKVLKQAGWVWNYRSHTSLKQLGYARTRSNACIYIRSKDGQHHCICPLQQHSSLHLAVCCQD